MFTSETYWLTILGNLNGIALIVTALSFMFTCAFTAIYIFTSDEDIHLSVLSWRHRQISAIVLAVSLAIYALTPTVEQVSELIDLCAK